MAEAEEALTERGDAVGLTDSSLQEPASLLDRVLHSNTLLDNSSYRSTRGRGNTALLEAIASHYDVQQRSVICTSGAVAGFALVLRDALRTKRHIIVEQPYYGMLVQIAREFGAEISFLPRSLQDGSFEVETLARLVRADTGMVVVSNLHNPTGFRLGDNALAEVAEWLRPRRILLLVDEVYRGLSSEGVKTAAVLSSNIVAVSSLTKSYGLSSLRCGWILAPEPIIDRLLALRPLVDFGQSKIGHALGVDIFRHIETFEHHARSVIAENRVALGEWYLASCHAGLIDGPLPASTSICFPKLKGIADTHAFAIWAWAHLSLALAPGELFGTPGHIRIGFGGANAQLKRGLERLSEALAAYPDRKTAPIRDVDAKHSAHGAFAS